MSEYHGRPYDNGGLIKGQYVQTVYKSGNLKYAIGETGFDSSKESLYSKLVGRLDSEIVIISEGDIIDANLPRANIILLDIRSMFWILNKRFNDINATNPSFKAANVVRQILDKFMDDYGTAINNELESNSDKLPALLIYLAVNAEMLGLVRLEDYILTDEVKITKKYLENITDKCDELYRLINNVLVNMKFS